jgi:hypothetical protein
MSEVGAPRRIGRSIGAVLIGIVVGVLLTLVTDMVLHVIGLFPPLGQPVADAPLVLATAYRIVYGALGSYIIALLAPNRPVLHALIGGAFGALASTVGAVVTWNRGPAFGPHWYPIALILTALPCAWVGGKLRLMQLRARPAP